MDARGLFDPIFVALALAIAAASAVGLWWLLHGESRWTWLGLAALSLLALTLRLAYPADFPRGLNEDEPRALYSAARALADGRLLAQSDISVPALMHALFQAQLIPLLGPGRWAMRGYSLVGGVLCVPAAFAAARALQLSVASSFAAAGLLAVLPWAIFYSRIMQGAELTFQQLLLIAALARLLFAAPADSAQRDGRGQPPIPSLVARRSSLAGSSARPIGWPEWALGTFALAWLLYGYWCTRAMLGLTLVAAVLARGRRRLWCLAIAAAALLLYAPYVLANRHSMFIAQGVDPAYYARFGDLAALWQRTVEGVSTLVWPMAEDGWLTIRAAALHPPLLLILAAFGALTGVRRAIFLLAGFLGGMAPAVLAWGAPSTHRMLMAFPFVALAAACGLDDLLIWPRLRQVASALLVLVVGWSGVRLYFSEAFWPAESRWQFNWATTELVDSLPLPPSPPVILMAQTTAFRYPRLLLTAGDQELSVDNWFPSEQGGIYAFTREAAPLRPFYESLLGANRIESFGPAFKVSLEPGDWAWLRAHGWSYEVRCGAQTRSGQVPALFHVALTFGGLSCEAPAQHSWRARWDGPAMPLRLRAAGPATVDAGAVHVVGTDDESVIDFNAEPGMEIRVTMTRPASAPSVTAELLAVTPAGEVVPDWAWVTPLEGAAPSAPGGAGG